MTGFGRQELELNNDKITIDIRSLNSKQTDINTRIPSLLKEKELEIRKLLSSKLYRGKIEISIFIESNDKAVNTLINENIIESYYNTLKKISDSKNIPLGNEIMSSILKMPEVMQANTGELNKDEWFEIQKAISVAIDNCINYRKEEGKSLANDITQNINSILLLLKEVDNYESERLGIIKQRLFDNLNNLNSEHEIDNNRLEQEVIYYLEKLDINEEKIRLEKHCKYFLETMMSDNSQGKKLGFITQEIGREINTLGSKANHAEMQKIVVNMKDELEKVKEQLFNVL